MYPWCTVKLRLNTRNLELKISTLGMYRITWWRRRDLRIPSFYNKTSYSGLETHILNSYTNPVVQGMHYLLPIRRLAKSHITTNCLRENCLFCELGFVVRMLEDARGTNCQTSNFCKVVGVLAQSASLYFCATVSWGSPSGQCHRTHRLRQGIHRRRLCSQDTSFQSFPHRSPEHWG